QRVTGRNDDMMIIRGVNVYPSQIESVLIGFPGVAPQYLLTLSRQGSMDHLTVETEAVTDENEEDRIHLAHQLRHHIKSIVGVSCEVIVRLPGELPRSMGKATRVRDLRKQGG
ncbi:MAG: phenylacetate--CoA ligase, partial [Magnetospirillum sp.]